MFTRELVVSALDTIQADFEVIGGAASLRAYIISHQCQPPPPGDGEQHICPQTMMMIKLYITLYQLKCAAPLEHSVRLYGLCCDILGKLTVVLIVGPLDRSSNREIQRDISAC